MCGIAGVVALDPRATLDTSEVLPMLRCIAHRGPDDAGIHQEAGVLLGHRRLSIIDLFGGHQPLMGSSPETAIICNGEIYNYRELRRELEARGHCFRTRSDTEVAAVAYDEWDLAFLERLDGMFALALWDGARRRLVLARDRLGEKPLYYAETADRLIFASELKALRAHPSVTDTLDLHALSEYLALEYVPAPRSILRGVRKLEPAQCLVLEGGRSRTFHYWQLKTAPPTRPIRFEAAVEQLRALLDEAVRTRLVSDVPLGVFLSGGVDSSTIAALAARHGALDTFAIGFREASFDETAHARRVAVHLGSSHHEHTFLAEDMRALIPDLPQIMDEPLGDASIIPTALLSRFARKHVTVALGGDGGDELFAGYPMHQARRLAPVLHALPGPVRGLVANGLRMLPVSHRNFALPFKVDRLLRGASQRPPLDHAAWMSSFTPGEQVELLSDAVLDHLRGGLGPFAAIERAWEQSSGAPPLARATHLDAVTYLPNDILAKVDRASMQIGLEVRAPFLARDVVEFAFSQPDRFRMSGFTGKRMLRAAAKGLLPDQILTRPKKGFGVPMAAWLHGPLRPMLQDVLSPDAIRAAGLFKAAHVARLVDEHITSRADHRKQLWTLLAFELWRRARST